MHDDAPDTLDAYLDRRDPDRTPEPGPGEGTADTAAPRFVVQEHAASSHHYDLRLEIDGVLVSWAVPEGPSTDPEVRRLALRTEDHPRAYAGFEGVIPEDEYGGGEVIVWDAGTYDNQRAPGYGGSDGDNGGDGDSGGDGDDGGTTMAEALAEGRIEVELHGEKLCGGHVLVRTSEETGPGDGRWLLMKRDDDAADARRRPTSTEPRSVLTGRTVDEVDRLPPELDGGEDAFMRATLQHGPREAAEELEAEGWVVERKLDGMRVLACRDTDGVRLRTRSGDDRSAAFPDIVAALEELDAGLFVADGELVAMRPGPDGGRVSSFQALQPRISGGVPRDDAEARRDGPDVYLYLFDLLFLAGRDLRPLPWAERKRSLREALSFDDPLRYTPHRRADLAERYDEACARGWEGLIAKDPDSTYVSERSRDWLKLKCSARQELVVVGFTEPGGDRPGLGALLVAVHTEPGGPLRYAGRVGTGFTEDQLRALRDRLDGLEVEACPVEDADLADEGVHFVQPCLVAEVGFTEWTDEGRMRHPRFLGLREDKDAADVVREDGAPGDEA